MNLHRLLGATLVALTFTACGDKDDDSGEGETSDCDGHGEWDVDHGHCHCDDGYSLSDGGYGCEENGAGEDDDDDDDDSWEGDDTGVEESSFHPDTVEATYYASSNVTVLTAKEGDTWLSIENYPDYGGATGPESRSIDATEANYATCGICVMVQTGCEPHGDHAHCDATFMPEPGGTIDFSAFAAGADESWTGTLTDIRFVEVRINSDTYESTPKEDGETLELNIWDFDVTVAGG